MGYTRINTQMFNEKMSWRELRKVNRRSLFGLYFAKILFYAGFILILLNNLNVFAPGSYFGAYNWVTSTVFSIGLIINFICIPSLYFSSYKNFIEDNDFWDKETFWILPLFFFGTFFMYGSQISEANALLILSIIIIAIIHLKFIQTSWKNLTTISNESLASHHQYLMTLKYLTVYYMLLLGVLVIWDPLQIVFVWIRLHV